MAATYEPIASQTLTADTGTVSFTSIPSGYTDLILVAYVRADRSGNTVSGVQVTVNADTGSNYSYTTLTGDGSSAASARSSSQSRILAPVATGASSPSDTYAVNIMHFLSYSNTNVYKTILGETAHSAWGVRRYVALWQSTSAITSISIVDNTANDYVAGCTFSLFGLKAA